MTNGLSVSDITPLGERPADIWRGRTGTSIAGVDSLGGTALGALPTTTGDLFVYDAATDTWVIVNDSTFGVPLTVEDEGTPLATAADTLNFVGAGVTATGTGGTKTITIPGGGSGSGTPGWFNVKDPAYGATGDGTTDDTAAINLAIAALVAAGKGVLYFPAGTYKVTAGLTTISVPCLVLGDGRASTDGTTDSVSQIHFTHATASLFTVSSDNVSFSQLALYNSAVASAGAGITVSGGGNWAVYDRLSVTGFYINIDLQEGGGWTMRDCYLRQSHKYGVKIRYISVPDGGDWSMVGCYIVDGANSSDAAIRIESGGGGKIANCKINSDPTNGFLYGLDLATTIQTSVLTITGCSFENVRSHVIHMTTSGTARWHSIDITGCQFSTQTTSAANAIFIAAGTLADFQGLTIAGCVFKAWNVTTAAAISLTKVNLVYITAVVRDGFASMLTTSGCTNIVDATGGVAAEVAISGTPSTGQVPTATGAGAATWQTPSAGASFATPAIVLGTAAAAGSAGTVIRSDGTIVAFDTTVPAALGTAATGSVALAARRDHVHPNTATGVKWTAGTSMPGSPSTNDRVTRTDINGGTDFFYDGTRWRSVQTFREDFGTGNTLAPDTVGTAWGRMTLWGTAFDLWILNWDISTYASATNNGTNFWTVSFSKFDSADTATNLDTFATSGDTQNAWTMRRRAIGAAVVAASFVGLRVTAGKTLSPGGIYFATAIEYQIIGT